MKELESNKWIDRSDLVYIEAHKLCSNKFSNLYNLELQAEKINGSRLRSLVWELSVHRNKHLTQAFNCRRKQQEN